MPEETNPQYRPSLIEENPVILIGLLVVLAFVLFAAVAKYAWYIHDRQLVEGVLWLLLAAVVLYFAVYQLTQSKSDREAAWPKQLPTIPVRGEKDIVESAWRKNSVVLGYDIHGKPWLWNDDTRVMQALVLGQSGTGKTTLLRNIISQDLMRQMGPATDRHKIPMIIFDGKGDLEFLAVSRILCKRILHG